MSAAIILGTGSRRTPNWLKGVIRDKLSLTVREAVAVSGGEIDEFIFLVGDAPGADTEIQQWVRTQSNPRIRLHALAPFKAHWEADCDPMRCSPEHRKLRSDGSDFCPAQGPYRNGRMVELARLYRAEGYWVRVAAFYADPNSTGTGDCVRQARAAGLEDCLREYGSAPGRPSRREVLGLRPSSQDELRQDGS